VSPAPPLDGEPGRALPPVTEAGAGPVYRVAVCTFRGSNLLRRDFGGRYPGA
jgi:hypothetical protein